MKIIIFILFLILSFLSGMAFKAHLLKIKKGKRRKMTEEKIMIREFLYYDGTPFKRKR